MLKRLYLYQISVLPNTKYLDHFVCNSLNYTLRYLYISGGSWTEPGAYFYPLIKVCPIVTEELYLDWFKFDDVILSTIIERSHKVERLCLVNMFIDISDTFKLSDKLDYKIKHLCLDETCVQKDKKSLNHGKSKRFFKAVGETSLKSSLEKISILQGDFNSTVLSNLFYDNKITAQLIQNREKRLPTGYNAGEEL